MSRHSSWSLLRFLCDGFASTSERVQTTARPIFARGGIGILPLTLEEAHRLEAAECPIERAIRRKQLVIGDIAQTLRDLVAVKCLNAVASERESAETNGQFEWDQPAWLPAHGRDYKQISAYLSTSVRTTL